MLVKKIIKKIIFKMHNVQIDLKSDLSLSIIKNNDASFSKIINSRVTINKMGHNCFLEHVYGYGEINLGDYVSISGPGTVLHSEKGAINIGSYTSIAANVSIQEFNHDYSNITTSTLFFLKNENMEDLVVSKGAINIKEDVWIGSNVVVLSGVTIGRGAVVAGGSVVTKEVEPYSIVAGNPAKKIKMRFNKEVIEYLENSKWWELGRNEIFDIIAIFNEASQKRGEEHEK